MIVYYYERKEGTDSPKNISVSRAPSMRAGSKNKTSFSTVWYANYGYIFKVVFCNVTSLTKSECLSS